MYRTDDKDAHTRFFFSSSLVVTGMRVYEGGRRINERGEEVVDLLPPTSLSLLTRVLSYRDPRIWITDSPHSVLSSLDDDILHTYGIYVRPTQSGFPRQSSRPKKRSYSNDSASRVQPYEEFIPFRWNFPKENGLTCPVSARTRASFHFF